jgi:hypothetical protein
MTLRLAHAALQARMNRNCDNPTSLMLLARWCYLTMFATCTSS